MEFYYNYPDPAALTAVILEGILFVIVAGIFAYLIERIHRSETGYRKLFENSQLGIVLFNPGNFSMLQVNEKFLGMLDYSRDYLKNRDFSELFFTPREKERFLERIKKHPDTADFETRFRSK